MRYLTLVAPAALALAVVSAAGIFDPPARVPEASAAARACPAPGDDGLVTLTGRLATLYADRLDPETGRLSSSTLLALLLDDQPFPFVIIQRTDQTLDLSDVRPPDRVQVSGYWLSDPVSTADRCSGTLIAVTMMPL